MNGVFDIKEVVGSLNEMKNSFNVNGVFNDIKEVVGSLNDMKNSLNDMLANISVSKLIFSDERSEKPKDTKLKSVETNSFQDSSAIHILYVKLKHP